MYQLPSTQLLFIGSWYIRTKHTLLYNQGFHTSPFAQDSPSFMSFKEMSRCPAKFHSGSQMSQVFPSHEKNNTSNNVYSFMSFKEMSWCPAKLRSGSQMSQVFPSHEKTSLLTMCTNILTLLQWGNPPIGTGQPSNQPLTGRSRRVAGR